MKTETNSLIFHHIPKAGGTTLNAIIRQNNDPRRVYSIYDTETCHSWAEYCALPDSTKSKLCAVVGHMPMGAHRELSQPANYITFFRDPTKRVLSLYRYVFRKEDHYLHEQATREQFSLGRFLDVAPAIETENGMVKALLFPEELPEGCVDESHFKKALENLDQYFPVYGLTDEFDASVCLFSKFFGWKTPYYMVRNARSGNHQVDGGVLSETDLGRLRELNEFDLRLYEVVKAKFMTLLEAELGADWRGVVEGFSKSNSQLKGKGLFIARALYGRFLMGLR
jgi:hypothetical protein